MLDAGSGSLLNSPFLRFGQPLSRAARRPRAVAQRFHAIFMLSGRRLAASSRASSPSTSGRLLSLECSSASLSMCLKNSSLRRHSSTRSSRMIPRGWVGLFFSSIRARCSDRSSSLWSCLIAGREIRWTFIWGLRGKVAWTHFEPKLHIAQHLVRLIEHIAQ
jgi:hypothetical protein